MVHYLFDYKNCIMYDVIEISIITILMWLALHLVAMLVKWVEQFVCKLH
jgi:hypothetical protein